MKDKVLIVEDDEKAKESLGRVVKKEGFEVLLAENGKQGLEIFKKELPEIIITDLKMPEIDGLELLHTAKHISPNTQVILITAYGDYDTAIAALREGTLDYLKKPIDLNHLTIALGRAREKIFERKKCLFTLQYFLWKMKRLQEQD